MLTQIRESLPILTLCVAALLFIYAVVWGTRAPAGSYVIMGGLVLAGLIGGVVAATRKNILLCAINVAVAIIGVPVLIFTVYQIAGP